MVEIDMIENLHSRRILLIISGGIAAYKSLDLIRRLREQGCLVRCVLTQGGSKFITPLSVAALSEERVYTDLWSLTDEHEMGHIRLSREADLVVVAPASANIIAKMAQGLADDLASTLLLATDKPVMIAPAMNGMMWSHAATQSNITLLRQRGVHLVGPAQGMMACGEEGEGRMADIPNIVAAIKDYFAIPGPLAGKRAIVTSGPTFEPLDPVRYLGNRSSGKQGHALAAALQRQGAETILVTGPTHLSDPVGVRTVHVQTAREMMAACEAALPADVAICAAAVADWRPEDISPIKLKKGMAKPVVSFVENPDILANLAQPGNRRPRLVIGFAAETDNVLENAHQKLERKGCDWLLANEVGPGKAFDVDDNQVTLIRRSIKDVQSWPHQTKEQIAQQLVEEIIHSFKAA